MANLFKLTLLMVLTGILIAFVSPQKNINKTDIVQIKHIELKITGMTCEIGCAKIIESKVSKMKGVVYAHVDFNKSLGQFSYDPNVTNSTKIIQKINGIGGGELYKVIGIKEVKSFGDSLKKTP